MTRLVGCETRPRMDRCIRTRDNKQDDWGLPRDSSRHHQETKRDMVRLTSERLMENGWTLQRLDVIEMDEAEETKKGDGKEEGG